MKCSCMRHHFPWVLPCIVAALTAALLPYMGCQQKLVPAPALLTPSFPSSVKVLIRDGGPVLIENAVAEFQVLPSGYIQASLVEGGKKLSLDEPRVGAPSDSNYLLSEGTEIHFTLDFSRTKILELQGKMGRGRRVEIPGRPLGPSAKTAIQQTLAIEAYDNLPNVIFTTLEYRNDSQSDLKIHQLVAQWHRLNAGLAAPGVQPYDMWSFRGSTYSTSQEDVLKITRAFTQPNVTPETLGHYGGDIPLAAFWTRSIGEALGHTESLPIDAFLRRRVEPDGRVTSCLIISTHITLKPAETYSSPRTFLAIYEGDYYEPLHIWSRVLLKEGWPIPKLLRPSKDMNQKKWAAIYDEIDGLRLGSATLQNLYVEGYDVPDGYVVERDRTRYYTFFAPAWNGEVELRGLKPGRYYVRDYEQGRELGAVDATTEKSAQLNVSFKGHLVIEATRK